MDEVRVLIGDRRYVTLYTMEKIDSLITLVGDDLPTASEVYRGKIFTLQGGSGVADACFICLKDASDSYYWENMLQFRFGP